MRWLRELLGGKKVIALGGSFGAGRDVIGSNIQIGLDEQKLRAQQLEEEIGSCRAEIDRAKREIRKHDHILTTEPGLFYRAAAEYDRHISRQNWAFHQTHLGIN
jgi:hypothetical protein